MPLWKLNQPKSKMNKLWESIISHHIMHRAHGLKKFDLNQLRNNFQTQQAKVAKPISYQTTIDMKKTSSGIRMVKETRPGLSALK